MEIEVIVWFVVGGATGWLAGLLVKGYGLGIVENAFVGIIGSIIAGWLLPRIGFVVIGGVIATAVDAVVGAVIFLLVAGFFKRAT